jgi:hypothetical protein
MGQTCNLDGSKKYIQNFCGETSRMEDPKEMGEGNLSMELKCSFNLEIELN